MSINLILCLNYHIEDINSHLTRGKLLCYKIDACSLPGWFYIIKTLNIL